KPSRGSRAGPLSSVSAPRPVTCGGTSRSHDEKARKMRWSQMHIPTLREDPADAGAPSHRLLVRAGYIRQLHAGHYSLLPLAVRVRAKVIDIIREEMNRIGAQELLVPTMHPKEVWE